MAGISKKETVLRRAAKALVDVYGKGNTDEARKAVDKVAKFIGSLSDIGFSAFLELSYHDDAKLIAKAARVEREAAKAARKAAKTQPVDAAAV